MEIKAKHHQAIELLIRGFSKAEVCRKLTIKPQTMSRWCNRESEFMDAYQARLNGLRAASGKEVEDWLGTVEIRGRALVDGSLNCLGQIMADPDASPAARVAAARLVIERFAALPGGAASEETTCDELELALQLAV